MDYSIFIETAIYEDGRNQFGHGMLTEYVPKVLEEFYTCANPIDVEITYPQIGAVRFCPCDELEELQQDYVLQEGDFAFATCNGDPLFVKDKQVFITLHGVYRPELIADSFENFLLKYISDRTSINVENNETRH